MRPSIFSLFAIVVCLSTSSLAQPSVPVSDFQIWNETVISIPLVKTKKKDGKEGEKLSLLLFGVLRFGQNLTRAVDGRIGFGFDLKLNNLITLSPTYLYRGGEPFRNRKEYEHRIRFDLTFEKKWKAFSIKDRNRVEYRFRNSRADSVRYRNKFTLRIPVYKDGKELFAPFVAEEPFYDFSARAWSSNEFSAGISKQFNKSVSAEFFYLLKNNRGSSPKYINAFGVNLKFKID